MPIRLRCGTQPLHACVKKVFSVMKGSLASVAFFKHTIFCPVLLLFDAVENKKISAT